MAVCLGENQRLGDLFSIREKLREEILTETADNGMDLTGVDNVPIQMGRSVCDIFVHLLPTARPGQTISIFDLLLQDCGAGFRDLRIDHEYIFTDIDAIDDGLLPAVFADHILIKESERAGVRRCGQTDEKSVKVLQNLTPDVIDGTVAFIDDNAVKEFRRNLFVVYNFFGGLRVGGRLLEERLLLGGFIQFLISENRIHTLDRTDTYLNIRRNVGVF